MTIDGNRRHGTIVADLNVPPPGIPWMVCYFEDGRGLYFRYGRRHPRWTAPVEVGGTVYKDERPGGPPEPIMDRSGRAFTWRVSGGGGSQIGRALAADLGAIYCETENEFDAFVEQMKEADPLREHRLG